MTSSSVAVPINCTGRVCGTSAMVLRFTFAARVYGAAVFRRWARLMQRTSNTLYEDAMIAATARVHGLTVVTRNVADFKSFGVELFNPFGKVRR